MTLLWSSLFTIIVVGLALWVLYYIIRAAVSAGIKDAYAQMGFIREPDTKEDQLQRRREELQEERVQTIVNAAAYRMSGKNANHSPSFEKTYYMGRGAPGWRCAPSHIRRTNAHFMRLRSTYCRMPPLR